MGASEFVTYAAGEQAGAAFREACEQAAWDSGHGGYTGTVAEKSDFTVIQREPLTREEADALAWKLIEQGDERIHDKWGPAGALPVKDDAGGVTGWLFFGWASS